MHCGLVVDLSSYLENYQAISESSYIIVLDYFLYSRIKDTKKHIYFINEFADAELIESWHSFVGSFLRNLSLYLSDTALKKERWLNHIDRPLVIYGLQDFNIFNVIPRLISFFLKKDIESLEIIGNPSEIFYGFLNDITRSLNIKVTNRCSINTCSQRILINSKERIIKKCLGYISNLKQRKKCIVFPDTNVPWALKKELVEANFDLAIINPSKNTIKSNITNASFHFTGLKSYLEADTALVKIEQIFNQIYFTESFFRLVELSFQKTSDFWRRERQSLENWVVKKEPTAIILSDMQEITPRLLTKIAKEKAIPTFHFPHGFYIVNSHNRDFIPLQMTDYVAVPGKAVKEYYINELNIDSGKVLHGKIFQSGDGYVDDKIKRENIVILEYGLSLNDFLDDYSLPYRFPYDLIIELKKIYPYKKIIYRERPGGQNKILKQIREYLKPLYKKHLFVYDENQSICRTCQSAKFVIGNVSTAFFEAIACNTFYYCYNPSKIESPPPFTSESPFVFSDIREMKEVLKREYPLRYLQNSYFKNNTSSLMKSLREKVHSQKRSCYE